MKIWANRHRGKEIKMIITGCIWMISIASSVLGKDKPGEWIGEAMSRKYTQVSEDTSAILLFSDTKLSYEKEILTFREKRLYHIIKTEGILYGMLKIPTIEGSDISDIKGFRYNSNGDLLETLEKKNINRSGYSKNFHDDSEYVTAVFNNIEAGDYVAFEYQHKRKLYFKDIVINMEDDIEIAFKRVGVPPEVQCTVLNDPRHVIQYSGNTYTVSSRKAHGRELESRPLRDRIPHLGISFVPEKRGNWQAVSRDYWEAVHQIPQLSETTKSELQELFNIDNTADFIRSVISHISENINYLDIEYGMGGYLPRSCDFVHEKKYGDCKDMACYAVAILREKGINAVPVLARPRSSGKVFEEFPSFQFNHLVIAVPLEGESSELKNMEINHQPYLIADPTSRHVLLPMIGEHLENTKILPITQEGSELYTVPVSKASRNIREYTVQMRYQDDKSLDIDLVCKKTGHWAVREKRFREILDKKKEAEIYRNWVQDYIPGSELQDFSVEISDEAVITHIRFSAKNAGSDVNGTLYFNPNFFEDQKNSYQKRERESDIDLGFCSETRLHFTVSIDDGFEILSIPSPGDVDNEFFSCSFQSDRDNNTVTLVKNLAWKQSLIPAIRYPEFREQYRNYLKIVKAPVKLKPRNGIH